MLDDEAPGWNLGCRLAAPIADELHRDRAKYDAGKRAFAEGDIEAACRELEASVALIPTAPLAQFEYARALLAAGETARARAALEAARKGIPPFQPVLEEIEKELARR